MPTTLEDLSAEYERAEASFLAAVRGSVARTALATAAHVVAHAASEFNAEAHRRLHSGVEDAWMPLDHLTERTEVLKELWEDVASAYEA